MGSPVRIKNPVSWELGSSGVQFYRGGISDVDPHVHVGCAAEMPDERRPFQSPDVPHLVVADVLVDEVGHFELFQPTLGVHTLRDFVLIAFAEGFDQRSQQVLNAFLLFRIEVGHGDPGNLFCIAFESDTIFRWCLGNPGLGALVFVERLVHAIGDQGLFPVDVPGMVFGFIEINNIKYYDSTAPCATTLERMLS